MGHTVARTLIVDYYVFYLCTDCLRSKNCPFGFGIGGVAWGQYYWLHEFGLMIQFCVSVQLCFASRLSALQPVPVPGTGTGLASF